MQRTYARTFLGFTANDIEDFVTIRRRFDSPLQYRLSINEINDLILTHETELKIQEERYRDLTQEQQKITQEIEEIEQSTSHDPIIDQPEKCITFPYQSFLNLRHWHKAPKSLKLFFQALTSFFSISKHDFLTELKINRHLIYTLECYQPSVAAMDEFRAKYSDFEEISPEYIRHKSFDAYRIAVWVYSTDANERLNRMKQPLRDKQNRIENKLKELVANHANKKKEIQYVEHRIKTLKKNLDRTEKHRQILF